MPNDSDLLDRKASFSNYGSYVFVDAPGSHIMSALPGGRYGIANGTSFSAPLVAGMAAVIRSIHYTGTAATIADSAVSIAATLSTPDNSGMVASMF